jgi:AraC family transcriptional regulator
VSLIRDRPGLVQFSGSPAAVISIHVGPSVNVDCRRGGARHRGTNVHGDVEIIPPNMAGVWEIKETDTALVVAIGLPLLQRVVEELGADPVRFEVTNRFQVRDSRIEHIAWALKAEMERGFPCGRLYIDGLTSGLAAAVVQNHSSVAWPAKAPNQGMSARTVRNVLAYIEDNLGRDLSLREIAAVSGLSPSHFKSQFRKAMGLPAHRYLVRQRVERAATLLRSGRSSIGSVALETGFCHQSHLAKHMRRLLGVTPREIKKGQPPM